MVCINEITIDINANNTRFRRDFMGVNKLIYKFYIYTTIVNSKR